ncbi:MAG: serine/threonine protein kinase [Planctomycetes bacterium]|nr:serine/threonine protein kinase [Planctomycetota bacterium]
MPRYRDVVAGHLLLLRQGVPLAQLWDALAALGRNEHGTLLEALEAAQTLSPSEVDALRADIPKVIRAERERTLLRLIHRTRGVDPQRLLGVFNQVREGGFAQEVGDRLVREGTVGAGEVQDLYEWADAALSHARAKRAEALSRLTRTPGRFGAAEADRLQAALQLCEGLLNLDRRPATRAPSDPALLSANEGPPPIDPEDCPIYGYEILSELGRGSMGVVYKAKHLLTDRFTALKVLPLKFADKAVYLERFKREAMALMRLKHEHIVRAYDFGGSEEYYYLALEFVDGETLDRALNRDGRLPERRVLDIGRQVALGLDAAAQAGVIHRDVKPENIMLTRDGVAKLCDFGIVKLDQLQEGTLTLNGTTVGTPHYISPEQARGEDTLDVRSDLYSLGISLYHLATGHVPFTGRSQGAILVRHILEPVPDPRTHEPSLSREFAEVVRGLTHKKPDDRYPSGQAAADAIAAVLEGSALQRG